MHQTRRGQPSEFTSMSRSIRNSSPVKHQKSAALTSRAKLAAAATAYTRAEGWHRGVVRPAVHTDRALVAALPAGNEQAPDAMPAHAAERHGTDWFIIPGHAGVLRTRMERNQVRSPPMIFVRRALPEVRRFQISLRSRCMAMLAGLRTLIPTRHGPD